MTTEWDSSSLEKLNECLSNPNWKPPSSWKLLGRKNIHQTIKTDCGLVLKVYDVLHPCTNDAVQYCTQMQQAHFNLLGLNGFAQQTMYFIGSIRAASVRPYIFGSTLLEYVAGIMQHEQWDGVSPVFYDETSLDAYVGAVMGLPYANQDISSSNCLYCPNQKTGQQLINIDFEFEQEGMRNSLVGLGIMQNQLARICAMLQVPYDTTSHNIRRLLEKLKVSSAYWSRMREVSLRDMLSDEDTVWVDVD